MNPIRSICFSLNGGKKRALFFPSRVVAAKTLVLPLKVVTDNPPLRLFHVRSASFIPPTITGDCTLSDDLVCATGLVSDNHYRQPRVELHYSRRPHIHLQRQNIDFRFDFTPIFYSTSVLVLSLLVLSV